MYFVLAIYYVGATIGAVSIFVFMVLAFSIFEEKTINQNFGYQNYFIILGFYALVAVPFAATVTNGNINIDFLFCLGCLCPAMWEIGEKLSQRHILKQSKILAAQIAAAEIPPMQAVPAHTAQQVDHGPAYEPAPSTLAADFDVPPQR